MKLVKTVVFTPVFSALEEELVRNLVAMGYSSPNLEPSHKEQNPVLVYENVRFSVTVTIRKDDLKVERQTKSDGNTDYMTVACLTSPMMAQLIHSICHNLRYAEF